MKNLLFLAALLMALASCKNSGTTETTDTAVADSTATTPMAEPVAAQPMCFLRTEGKDSTIASINIAADGTVTGSFSWQPFEQHGADGTLTGKQEGDLLKVTYDYTIEGSNQQEEKIFKLAGDQLQEGSGELMEGEEVSLKSRMPRS
ncbi:MAG: hypothetical protein IPN76_18135 [Saprospiraceae bacterium]|nr:hypothetical protein [Saprospiraceae bacterium]